MGRISVRGTQARAKEGSKPFFLCLPLLFTSPLSRSATLLQAVCRNLFQKEAVDSHAPAGYHDINLEMRKSIINNAFYQKHAKLINPTSLLTP